MKPSISRNKREGWYAGRTRGTIIEHIDENFCLKAPHTVRMKRRHKRNDWLHSGYCLRFLLPF